jgi:DNA polymerase-3 subunit alpha
MFTHLHTHTEYSLLDGMSKIGPLMDRVKALGQVAIAMTDHGALYGAIDFYREATARGIKPIIGVEAYVAPGSRFSREKSESSPYHLVLLARNLAGYKNLIALVTKANLEGYYYKPRIDRELIEKHCEGLTVLSGCPSSEFHRRVQEGDREGAIAVAKYYREVFDGHYYLEVQDHGDEKFTRLNPVIADIGRELGIPVVATNDSHYTFPEDAEAHDILLCIGTNATVDQRDRYRFDGHGYYLKSEEEMLRLFPENPEFITNTMLVADECDLELKFDRQLLPEPPVPPGRTSDDYLAELCFRGLRERFEVVTPELEERLRYELDVLRQTGFTDYMFVVKEIADYARKSGIRMGVRGSAAASLVLYVLKVTDIDPVANRLVFERFLNIERREMPDVDFDFADDRRDEMIRFAYERYGRDAWPRSSPSERSARRPRSATWAARSASPTPRPTGWPGSCPMCSTSPCRRPSNSRPSCARPTRATRRCAGWSIPRSGWRAWPAMRAPTRPAWSSPATRSSSTCRSSARPAATRTASR